MGLQFDEIALGYPVRMLETNQVGIVVNKNSSQQTVDILLAGDWSTTPPVYTRVLAIPEADVLLEPLDETSYPSPKQIQWDEDEQRFQQWIDALVALVPAPIQIDKTVEEFEETTHSVTMTFSLSKL